MSGRSPIEDREGTSASGSDEPLHEAQDHAASQTLEAPLVALRWFDAWMGLRRFSAVALPPPPATEALHRMVWGLSQPFLGARMVLRDRGLLGTALAPVVAIAFLCMLVFLKEADRAWWERLGVSFAFFVSLAPLPAVLFHRTYARIAAHARVDLGLSPREPYLKSLGQPVTEAIAQSLILAIGVAPITAMVRAWDPTGVGLAFVVTAAWTLHWMVIEGLDSARTLVPGDTVAAVEQRERQGRVPWFRRPFHGPLPRLLRIVLFPVNLVGQLVAYLSRGWEEELALVERHPWACIGFGLGTFALLAVPGLNLFLRPAVAVGGAHLRGRLELEDARRTGAELTHL